MIVCTYVDKPAGGANEAVDKYMECFTLGAGAVRAVVRVLVHSLVGDVPIGLSTNVQRR